MIKLSDWKRYDPLWLIDLAREQHEDKKWLADAFSKCNHARAGGAAYIYFVDPRSPNKPGSEWQFDQNLILECPERGQIIIDVLKGNRVGGIEMIKELI